MNPLHILFAVVVGSFLVTAYDADHPQLFFGAVVMVFLSYAMRAQGRWQTVQEVKRAADALQEEDDSGDKNSEGGSHEPGNDEV